MEAGDRTIPDNVLAGLASGVFGAGCEVYRNPDNVRKGEPPMRLGRWLGRDDLTGASLAYVPETNQVVTSAHITINDDHSQDLLRVLLDDRDLNLEDPVSSRSTIHIKLNEPGAAPDGELDLDGDYPTYYGAGPPPMTLNTSDAENECEHCDYEGSKADVLRQESSCDKRPTRGTRSHGAQPLRATTE